MSGLSYEQSASSSSFKSLRSLVPTSGEGAANMRSYAAFERLTWTSFGPSINSWRFETLRLPRVRIGSKIDQAITRSSVPFSAMWSPAFLPKPHDWPEQCEVVGTFTQSKKQVQDFDTTPFADLVEWLAAGDDDEQPIFVGFGSMVIENPQEFANIVAGAAVKAGCRVVVQSSWSKIEVEEGKHLFNVGPCPHDWLLPQMSAVVHHGGAGTTAAGLRYGKPTFVCPFFADQHMWGAMVNRAGVGPSPCPFSDLTEDILVKKFSELQEPSIRMQAEELAEAMAREDGVSSGLKHFLAGLPRENMLCDVGLLLGETRMARFRLKGSNIKVCVGVAACLRSIKVEPLRSPKCRFRVQKSFSTAPKWFASKYRSWHYGTLGEEERHAVTTYALGHVNNIRQGIGAGVGLCCTNVICAPLELWFKPDKYARTYGAAGCLVGILLSPIFIVLAFFNGLLRLVDRVATGFYNTGHASGHRLYCFDPSIVAPVHELGTYRSEMQALAKRGICPEKKEEFLRALDMVIIAKDIFDESSPDFPKSHWHYRVVPVKKLRETMKALGKSLKLSEPEFKAFLKSMEEAGDGTWSFSMFIHKLRQTISDRYLDDRV